MSEEKEFAVIKKIQNGNYYLFEKIILAYQKKLFSFVNRIIKNSEDTKDICQDAFINAYKSINVFNFKSKFSTWLFQIAYNTSINYIKRQKNKNKIELNYRNSLENKIFHDHFEKNEINKIIKTIVSKLDREYQIPLFLFYSENASYEEISAIMKKNINTVKSYIFRGKNMIKKKLIEDFKFEIED